MSWSDRVREVFDTDDTIVSALPGAELSGGSSSQDRFRLWRAQAGSEPDVPVEYLLPRVVRKFEQGWPPYMFQRGALRLSPEALAARIEELQPWLVPFRFDHGQFAMGGHWRIPRDRSLYRRELIVGTAAELLGEDLRDSTVLDIGCNNGFFSLDIASRGAKHVTGVDLRQHNIDQATFLAEHYGVDNVEFRVSDSAHLTGESKRDVVLNLGVLYHVTDPLQFLRQTYELCRKFAIIDTRCALTAVSAFFLLGDKDVDRLVEGREPAELLPTYRGAIDAIRYAGFSEVVEVEGVSEPLHPFYRSGTRRCFLAIK